jgi:hypothetical protein
MVPAATLIKLMEGSRDPRHTSAPTRVRSPRAHRSALRVVLGIVLIVGVAAAAASIPYVRYLGASARASELEASYASMTATAREQSAALYRHKTRLWLAQGELEQLRAAKISTVVETRTVTREVVRWIPSGAAVSVEVTGFEGVIALHDVQLTHAYGFTDLVGIAVNKSSETLSYAQLGCTFLDADGNVLANAMANKQAWAPHQSWGFTCSAEVDAAGGILRVDEVS